MSSQAPESSESPEAPEAPESDPESDQLPRYQDRIPLLSYGAVPWLRGMPTTENRNDLGFCPPEDLYDNVRFSELPEETREAVAHHLTVRPRTAFTVEGIHDAQAIANPNAARRVLSSHGALIPLELSLQHHTLGEEEYLCVHGHYDCAKGEWEPEPDRATNLIAVYYNDYIRGVGNVAAKLYRDGRLSLTINRTDVEEYGFDTAPLRDFYASFMHNAVDIAAKAAKASNPLLPHVRRSAD